MRKKRFDKNGNEEISKRGLDVAKKLFFDFCDNVEIKLKRDIETSQALLEKVREVKVKIEMVRE
jgi:hypothetical protein